MKLDAKLSSAMTIRHATKHMHVWYTHMRLASQRSFSRSCATS